MDERLTDYSIPVPHSGRFNPSSPPRILSDYGVNLGLSDAAALGHWDHPASGSAEAERERQVLEQLLGPVAAGGAGQAARTILKRHGTLARALARSDDATIGQDVACFLKNVREVLSISLQRCLGDQPIISTSQHVIEYLTFVMGHLMVEEVRALFLDGRNGLLCDETLARGTVNEAPIYPREIVRRAFDLGATAIILVHNHPSGNPTPSQIDVELTQRLLRICRDLDIELHDHLIITATAWTSFRHEGLLV